MAVGSIKSAAAGFVVGAIAAYVACSFLQSEQITKLKQFADSVATKARADSEAVIQYSDSVKKVVDSLEQRKMVVVSIVKGNKTTVAQLDQALKSLTTKQDSIVNMAKQLGIYKDSIVPGLENAVVLANRQFMSEKFRGDTLETTVYALNRSVQDLTAKVNAIHQKPKWLSISIETLKLGGAFVAGYVAH